MDNTIIDPRSMSQFDGALELDDSSHLTLDHFICVQYSVLIHKSGELRFVVSLRT